VADDTMSKLLLSSIERHDRAVRWSWILIAVLAAFHLTTFERFVDTRRAMDRSDRELARLKQLGNEVDLATKAFENDIETVQQAAVREVEDAFLDLSGRFAILNLEVAKVWCNAHHEENSTDYWACVKPAAERINRHFPELREPVAQVSIEDDPLNLYTSTLGTEGLSMERDQMIVMTAEALVQEKILPAELSDSVASLPDRDDRLIDLLESLIDAELVAPVFEGLNRFWKTEQAPEMTRLADDAAASLMRFGDAGGEIEVKAKKAVTAAKEIKQSAMSFTFEPPQEKRWWLLVSDKERVSTQLVNNVDEKFMARRVLSQRFQSLFKDLSKALAKEQDLREELADVMKELQEVFEAQRAQLSQVLEPFKVVAIDLEFFCRHFTLILALAGAAVLIWPAEKRRIVRLTAEMASNDGRDSSVWLWFVRRRQRTIGSFAARGGFYAIGVSILIWSFYAAVRLAGLADAAPRIWWELTFGGAVLGGAIVWCWRLSEG